MTRLKNGLVRPSGETHVWKRKWTLERSRFTAEYGGMNLNGISDTTSTASHFWEVAVPLTGAIAIPCLLLAFWGRLRRLHFSLKKPKED
jgi:hypothetical protein